MNTSCKSLIFFSTLLLSSWGNLFCQIKSPKVDESKKREILERLTIPDVSKNPRKPPKLRPPTKIPKDFEVWWTPPHVSYNDIDWTTCPGNQRVSASDFVDKKIKPSYNSHTLKWTSKYKFKVTTPYAGKIVEIVPQKTNQASLVKIRDGDFSTIYTGISIDRKIFIGLTLNAGDTLGTSSSVSLRIHKTEELLQLSQCIKLDFSVEKDSNCPGGERVDISEIVDGGKKTSSYGMRIHPTLNKELHHSGIDWRAAIGTEIRSPFDGQVVRVRDDPDGYGHYITIKHSAGYYSRYAHLKEILVKEGKMVEAGDRIALSGNTGQNNRPLTFTSNFWKQSRVR